MFLSLVPFVNISGNYAVSFGKNRDGGGNQKRDIQNVQNKGKEARLSNAPDPLDQERA